MGENIADLGGLLLALDAYHMSLKGKPAPVIDGLTGDQRVFLGWAPGVACASTATTALRQQLRLRPALAGRMRAGRTCRSATSTPSTRRSASSRGDKAYVKPEDRVRIW